MKLCRNICVSVAAFLTIGLAADYGKHGWAQQGDEQLRFLEVRRRQLELQAAHRQLERTEQLVREGLVSQNDIERDRNAVSAAQLNYQQAVLSLLDLQLRISVRSAIKTQSRDGRKFVRLVIVNLTPTLQRHQTPRQYQVVGGASAQLARHDRAGGHSVSRYQSRTGRAA